MCLEHHATVHVLDRISSCRAYTHTQCRNIMVLYMHSYTFVLNCDSYRSNVRYVCRLRQKLWWCGHGCVWKSGNVHSIRPFIWSCRSYWYHLNLLKYHIYKGNFIWWKIMVGNAHSLLLSKCSHILGYISISDNWKIRKSKLMFLQMPQRK